MIHQAAGYDNAGARHSCRSSIRAAGAPAGGLGPTGPRLGSLCDACAAGPAGSAPGTPIFKLWKDLGVVDH